MWSGERWKVARRCGAEAHFQVKMYKTPQLRNTFRSWDVEKVHAIVARSTFRSQNVKNTTCSDHFWTFRCRFAWQAQGIVHLVKSEQNVRVLWHFQKRWQAWDIWRRWSAQIFRFAEVISWDRCSTSYDLASLFPGRRNTLDRWSGKIAKCTGTRPSALHSTFYFWKKSRRIAAFLMLSTSKNEEVSQNLFVFDVVKFKIEKSRRIAALLLCQVQNWGSLAE